MFKSTLSVVAIFVVTMLSGCTTVNHYYPATATGPQHQSQVLPRPQIIQKNDCSACSDQPGRIAVIRANGQLACRLVSRPAEPGEKMCN